MATSKQIKTAAQYYIMHPTWDFNIGSIWGSGKKSETQTPKDKYYASLSTSEKKVFKKGIGRIFSNPKRPDGTAGQNGKEEKTSTKCLKIRYFSCRRRDRIACFERYFKPGNACCCNSRYPGRSDGGRGRSAGKYDNRGYIIFRRRDFGNDWKSWKGCYGRDRNACRYFAEGRRSLRRRRKPAGQGRSAGDDGCEKSQLPGAGKLAAGNKRDGPGDGNRPADGNVSAGLFSEAGGRDELYALRGNRNFSDYFIKGTLT